MHPLLAKHRALWCQRSFVLSVIHSALVFALGGLFIQAARAYATHTSIHTLSSPDLLLDALPTFGMENFLVWGVPVLLAVMAIILFLYPTKIPFTFKTMGVLFLVRAFFVILTPLGIRSDQTPTLTNGFFQSLNTGNDFFFSGHVAFPFLFACIFWEVRWVRIVMLSLSGLFGIAVLLAHTHYSIDVFAVPFMIPTIYRLSLQLFRSPSLYETQCHHPSV